MVTNGFLHMLYLKQPERYKIKGKYIDVKGIRTRYLEAGFGEPLLLIHGAHPGSIASANDWDPVIVCWELSLYKLS